MGNLVGALPEYPRQHHNNGLPLVLMPEEVRLLQKLHLIIIVDSEALYHQHKEQIFSSEPVQSFYKQLAATEYDEMNRAAKEARKSEIDAHFEAIVRGKMKKLGLSESLTGDEKLAFEEKVRSELYASITDVPRYSSDSHALIFRFHTESLLSKVENKSFSPPPFELPALPPRSLHALKTAVFEDFWRRGYYISDGIKFGAHFLAYDHDPISFHAKFIIMCVTGDASEGSSSLANFEGTLLQAYGRLARNVKKNTIIAHWKSDDNEKSVVSYKHVQWSALPGFS